jgi:hypothetical protein
VPLARTPVSHRGLGVGVIETDVDPNDLGTNLASLTVTVIETIGVFNDVPVPGVVVVVYQLCPEMDHDYDHGGSNDDDDDDHSSPPSCLSPLAGFTSSDGTVEFLSVLPFGVDTLRLDVVDESGHYVNRTGVVIPTLKAAEPREMDVAVVRYCPQRTPANPNPHECEPPSAFISGTVRDCLRIVGKRDAVDKRNHVPGVPVGELPSDLPDNVAIGEVVAVDPQWNVLAHHLLIDIAPLRRSTSSCRPACRCASCCTTCRRRTCTPTRSRSTLARCARSSRLSSPSA